MPSLPRTLRSRRRAPFGVWVSFVLQTAFIVTVIPLSASGCRKSSGPHSLGSSQAFNNSHLRTALQLTPEDLRQMDPVTFTVRLSDAQGQPLDGARVTVDLTMPAMEMGKNTVVAHPQGAGVYSGTGRFSMSGDWNIVVRASKGPEGSTQTTRVHVR